MSTLEIRPIEVEQTRALRGSVLRPGCGPEESVFPSDDVPGALHVGALSGEEVVGIASIFPEAWPHEPGSKAWRLRGMAVDPRFRRRGIGADLVRACLAHVRAQGGVMLWCNARTVAFDFYRELGFESVGDEFEIADIGPHYLMRFIFASGH